MMTTFKSVYLFVSVVCVLSAVLCVATADAQTVHALLVIMDDDPTIGNNVEVDRKRVKQLLASVQSGICEVNITHLLSSEDTATRDKVLQWVQNVSIATDDVLFIYYAGHGGMNRNQQTFLATEGKWLFRSELVDAIERVKSHRLTILITDCCSSLVQTDIEPTLQSSRSMTRLTERVLRNLFLEHKGFLHVTGATEGQYGWSNTRTGGWFTRSFIAALDSNPDENQDSFLTWKEVFEKARENTEKTFNQTTFTAAQRAKMAQLGITSQTPKAYSLPTPLGGSAAKAEERKTVNYIFLAIVLGTLFISNRMSRGLKKQHASSARRNTHSGKTFAIIALEVLIWIGFNVFWQFFRTHWIPVCVIGIVMVGMILFRKQKRYA